MDLRRDGGGRFWFSFAKLLIALLTLSTINTKDKHVNDLIEFLHSKNCFFKEKFEICLLYLNDSESMFGIFHGSHLSK